MAAHGDRAYEKSINATPPNFPKLDATIPGKLTEYRALGIIGAQAQAKAKDDFGGKTVIGWIPSEEEPIYKHPLNNHVFLSAVRGIMRQWKRWGFNADASGKIKVAIWGYIARVNVNCKQCGC